MIRGFLLAPGFHEERDTEGDAERGEADTQVHGAPVPPQDVYIVQPAAVDVHLDRAGEADGEGDTVPGMFTVFTIIVPLTTVSNFVGV